MAKVVRVRMERTPSGMFMATSPDLKGLLVAKYSEEELEQAIPQNIADLYAVSGEQVLVTPAEDESDDDGPEDSLWVAVPVEIARRALKIA